MAEAYQTDDGRWVVADEWWLPGIYDSEAAAHRAAEFTDGQLASLALIYRVDGENRPVTMADLDALENGASDGRA